MKNKILLLLVVILSIVLVKIRSSKEETSFFYNEIRIKDVNSNAIVSMDIEEYLIGVLAGEMPASFQMEALKAQAVASRTYAYYKIINSKKDYDVTNDNTTQVYITKEEMKEKWKNEYAYYFDKIKNAVMETKGEVLIYNNKIIPAYYFSMSNGYTESSLTAFKEDLPYLKSVVSKENEDHRNFKVIKTLAKEEFVQKLGLISNDIKITNVTTTESHRINSLQINDKTFTGIEVRKLLNLRSTDFTIVVENDFVSITTLGYGHGVGMSQYGANTMSQEGASYQEILLHYYQGVNISDINSIK